MIQDMFTNEIVARIHKYGTIKGHRLYGEHGSSPSAVIEGHRHYSDAEAHRIMWGGTREQSEEMFLRGRYSWERRER